MLKAYEDALADAVSKRIELKKLWQSKNSFRDKDTDLTKIEIADNITLRGKPFFLWELQFGEVFRREGVTNPTEQGFDIVIANPPYIRHEKISEYKEAFQRNYQTYAGTADILVYFYEKAFNILRERGTLTFITSNKYFRAGYGEKLRGFLGSQGTIKQIIDFGDAPVFEAAAYASIIVLRKGVPDMNQTRVWTFPQNELVKNFEEGFNQLSFSLPQHELKAEGWRLERSEVLRLFEKLKSRGEPLGEYVDGRFYRGVLTGLNAAFVVDRATRDQMIKEDESSKDILKPYLRGRDVKRWQANSQDLWLIFTRRGTDIEKYPAIKKHLAKFKNQLMPTGKKDPKTGKPTSRKSGSYKWFEIQDNIAYWEEFEHIKVLTPAIEKNTAFAIDNSGYFSNDKTSICVTSEPRFLTAVLNSSLLWWMIQQTASEKQNEFYEFKPMYVTALPIPSAEDWQKNIIEKLVDYILFLASNAAAQHQLVINYLESIINAAVYELFLSDELHAADKYFFEPLAAEDLPLLGAHAGKELEVVRSVFDRLSDVNQSRAQESLFLRQSGKHSHYRRQVILLGRGTRSDAAVLTRHHN